MSEKKEEPQLDVNEFLKDIGATSSTSTPSPKETKEKERFLKSEDKKEFLNWLEGDQQQEEEEEKKKKCKKIYTIYKFLIKKKKEWKNMQMYRMLEQKENKTI